MAEPPWRRDRLAGSTRETRYVNGGLFEEPAAGSPRARRAASCCASPASTTGARSSRTSSDRCCRARLAARRSSARRALHARGRHPEGRQARASSTPGASGSRPPRRYAELQTLQHDLLNYVVLDPACGSGNFLYTAYRELRRLERRLHEREQRAPARGGPPRRRPGRARRVLPADEHRGHRHRRLRRLARPRDALDGTQARGRRARPRRGDAAAGRPVGHPSRRRASPPWPQASVIVGNPPFHGDRNLRGLLGDDYVEWLKREFECGVKDHCVYWFRKAHDHLEAGQRAGLVGTNSISQNRARSASLNYVVERRRGDHRRRVDAAWPGEAAVEVSIVNWIKAADEPPRAVSCSMGARSKRSTPRSRSRRSRSPTFRSSQRIAGARSKAFCPERSSTSTSSAARRCCRGPTPRYEDVVKPYLDGRDIARDHRSATQPLHRSTSARWTLEDAMRYPAALDIVRDAGQGCPRDEHELLAETLAGGNSSGRGPTSARKLGRSRPLHRRHGHGQADSVRLVRARLAAEQRHECLRARQRLRDGRPDEPDPHRLGGARVFDARADIRYTPTSAFDTFPWPQTRRTTARAASRASHAR